jgi:hypothetical protein
MVYNLELQEDFVLYDSVPRLLFRRWDCGRLQVAHLRKPNTSFSGKEMLLYNLINHLLDFNIIVFMLHCRVSSLKDYINLNLCRIVCVLVFAYASHPESLSRPATRFHVDLDSFLTAME